MKLRDISTIGMKTLKASLIIFIIKKSQYRSAFSWLKLKQSSDQERVFWSFICPQSSKLDDSWGIENLTQRTTTFMFCTRASSASIIEKILVKFGPKTEQWWNLSRIVQTYKSQYVGCNTQPKVALSRLCIHHFQL